MAGWLEPGWDNGPRRSSSASAESPLSAESSESLRGLHVPSGRKTDTRWETVRWMLNSTLNGDSTDDDKRFNASNNGFGLILGQPIKSRGGGIFYSLFSVHSPRPKKRQLGSKLVLVSVIAIWGILFWGEIKSLQNSNNLKCFHNYLTPST